MTLATHREYCISVIEIPKYPPDNKDVVARSIARPDACAKPFTMNKGVRVRVNLSKSDVKIRKKKRGHDKRDVQFY